jgi:hypothetical protein
MLCGGTPLIENPGSTSIDEHERFVWLVSFLAKRGIKLWRASFWMRKYGSISYKRTKVWSPSVYVGLLDMGKITAKEKRGCVKTTSRCTDPNTGQVRYQGNENLKQTEFPNQIWL